MGPILKVVLFILPLYLAYTFYSFLGDDPLPNLKDEYWGPASKSHLKDDETIKPFKIDISAAVINDLKTRLKNELDSNRHKAPLEGIGFEYGFNSNFIRKVTTYWLEKYDWKARQENLNRYPHFKTQIGGLDIHFQHIKPPKSNKYKNTLPLILIHGWPGSFVEHQRIVPYLLEPENSDVNFELIIPSIPGYGFSDPASRPGFYPMKAAHIFIRLMKRLGFKEYYTSGEDWGSMISTDMAILDPNVKASHFACYSLHPKDMLKAAAYSYIYPSLAAPTPRTYQRFIPYSNVLLYNIQESGYLHIQATKPDTIGTALSQSPSGLAAYILEKFSTWTNAENRKQEDGGLLERFTLDHLLDNVMIYWVTNSITSSMRIYKETFMRWGSMRIPVTTPTGCVATPEDVIYGTEWTINTKYPNLQQYTSLEEGGHFASYEIPQLVAKAAVKFFNNFVKNQTQKK